MTSKFIGILPAAGSAKRFNGIEKQKLKIGNQYLWKYAYNLLNPFADEIFVIVNENNQGSYKEIIPTIKEHSQINGPRGLPTALCSISEEFVDAENIYGFAMPDCYFTEDQPIFKPLLDKIRNEGADLALGIFKTTEERTKKLGVTVIKDGNISEIVDKPQEFIANTFWGVALYTDKFFTFMKEEIKKHDNSEVLLGDIFNTFIKNNEKVAHVVYDTNIYFDVANEQDYQELQNELSTKLD